MRQLCRPLTTLALLLIMLTVAPYMAEQAAAPPLTRVTPFMIGSDGTAMTLVPPSYPHNVDKTFAGTELHIRLRYSGYPNWNGIFIKANGHIVKWQEISRVMIDNPASGYYHNIKLPFNELTRNAVNSLDIIVHGSNGGQVSACLTGIRIN